MSALRLLAENLKRIRRERNYSQEELAEATGFATAQLSRFERKAANPTLKTLQRLAESLAVAPSELLVDTSSGLSETELQAFAKALAGIESARRQALLRFLRQRQVQPGANTGSTDSRDAAAEASPHLAERVAALDTESRELIERLLVVLGG